MKTVTVTLTVDELGILFKSLGRMPFEQVYQLIGKLNEQANQQLSGSAPSPFIKTTNEGTNEDGR